MKWYFARSGVSVFGKNVVLTKKSDECEVNHRKVFQMGGMAGGLTALL